MKWEKPTASISCLVFRIDLHQLHHIAKWKKKEINSCAISIDLQIQKAKYFFNIRYKTLSVYMRIKFYSFEILIRWLSFVICECHVWLTLVKNIYENMNIKFIYQKYWEELENSSDYKFKKKLHTHICYQSIWWGSKMKKKVLEMCSAGISSGPKE